MLETPRQASWIEISTVLFCFVFWVVTFGQLLLVKVSGMFELRIFKSTQVVLARLLTY